MFPIILFFCVLFLNICETGREGKSFSRNWGSITTRRYVLLATTGTHQVEGRSHVEEDVAGRLNKHGSKKTVSPHQEAVKVTLAVFLCHHSQFPGLSNNRHIASSDFVFLKYLTTAGHYTSSTIVNVLVVSYPIYPGNQNVLHLIGAAFARFSILHTFINHKELMRLFYILPFFVA